MKSLCDTVVRACSARLPTEADAGADTAIGTNTDRKPLRHSARAGGFASLLLAGVMTLPGAVALADGDAEAGADKAHTCLGCHGVKHYVNTYPTYHVPRIAGQNREYLVAALHAYRDQTRSHPTMQANAGLLSDQDIEDIAAWLAAQSAN